MDMQNGRKKENKTKEGRKVTNERADSPSPNTQHNTENEQL